MDTQNLADLKLITPVVVRRRPAPKQKATAKADEVKMEQQVLPRGDVTDRPEVVQKGTSVTREGQSPPSPVRSRETGISGNAKWQPVRRPEARGLRYRRAAAVIADEPPRRRQADADARRAPSQAAC